MKRSSKVIDATPTWAPFTGWSVLLERAEAGIGLGGTGAAELAFARRFDQLADAFAAETGETFARLPQESFHITLCDGINAGMRKHLAPDSRQLLDPLVAMTVVGEEIAALRRAAERPVRWRPVALEIRGHAVVVTVHTDARLDDVRTQRLRLLERLGTITGAALVTPWQPHMTLGYLVDDEHIDRARSLCSGIWDQSSPEPGGTQATLLTGRADIYEFSDMATFWSVSAR